MAKIHLDRLVGKYPEGTVRGAKYGELIEMIIAENSTKIQNRIARQSKGNWDKALKKITVREKRFILPDITDILPKRSVALRKAAEKGELLRDKLRDQLTAQLRTSMKEFAATGQPTFVSRRGVTAGRISPKLINNFQEKIQNTFANYNKRDPRYGIPANIRGIAVTEVRSSINEIKYKYNETLLEKNPDLEMRKKWIQNRSQAEEPRKGHSEVDNKTIPYHEYFKVPLYKKKKGKFKKVGITFMLHPHDPNAPVEQNANCNCDYDILVLKKNIKTKSISNIIMIFKGVRYAGI